MKRFLALFVCALISAPLCAQVMTMEQQSKVEDFYYSIKNCKVRDVREAVNNGMKLNLNTAAQEYNTPLIISIKNDCIELTRYFLTQDVKVNAVNERDNVSPLNLVMRKAKGSEAYNWLNVSNELLGLGANPNYKDKMGETALIIAVRSGHDYYVSQLINDGRARLDQTDNRGWTALMHATERNDVRVMRMLIDAGANVRKAGPKGATPLMIAQHYGYADAAKILQAALNSDQ